MTITIGRNGCCLLGFGLESGLSVWRDYISAIEELFQLGKTNRSYRIDNFRLEMELLDEKIF